MAPLEDRASIVAGCPDVFITLARGHSLAPLTTRGVMPLSGVNEATTTDSTAVTASSRITAPLAAAAAAPAISSQRHRDTACIWQSPGALGKRSPATFANEGLFLTWTYESCSKRSPQIILYSSVDEHHQVLDLSLILYAVNAEPVKQLLHHGDTAKALPQLTSSIMTIVAPTAKCDATRLSLSSQMRQRCHLTNCATALMEQQSARDNCGSNALENPDAISAFGCHKGDASQPQQRLYCSFEARSDFFLFCRQRLPPLGRLRPPQ